MAFELDAAQQWLHDVRCVPSPNCDARPGDGAIDLIVIHGISLPPRHYGGSHIDRLFTNTLNPDEHPYFEDITGLRVSAHLLVDRAGLVTQYVPFHLRAWHAGESAFRGRPVCNDYSIGIELEGCDEEPYEDVQYAVAAELALLLMRTWPAIEADRVVGHCDVAPGRKTDPGPAFDWTRLESLLR